MNVVLWETFQMMLGTLVTLEKMDLMVIVSVTRVMLETDYFEFPLKIVT